MENNFFSKNDPFTMLINIKKTKTSREILDNFFSKMTDKFYSVTKNKNSCFVFLLGESHRVFCQCFWCGIIILLCWLWVSRPLYHPDVPCYSFNMSVTDLRECFLFYPQAFFTLNFFSTFGAYTGTTCFFLRLLWKLTVQPQSQQGFIMQFKIQSGL